MSAFKKPGSEGNLVKAIALGACVGVLYAALFLLEEPILELAGHGRWYTLIPVAIAFFFSLVHGAFTGRFWDLLGVKARK